MCFIFFCPNDVLSEREQPETGQESRYPPRKLRFWVIVMITLSFYCSLHPPKCHTKSMAEPSCMGDWNRRFQEVLQRLAKCKRLCHLQDVHSETLTQVHSSRNHSPKRHFDLNVELINLGQVREIAIASLLWYYRRLNSISVWAGFLVLCSTIWQGACVFFGGWQTC